jgi:hypothetical protein
MRHTPLRLDIRHVRGIKHTKSLSATRAIKDILQLTSSLHLEELFLPHLASAIHSFTVVSSAMRIRTMAHSLEFSIINKARGGVYGALSCMAGKFTSRESSPEELKLDSLSECVCVCVCEEGSSFLSFALFALHDYDDEAVERREGCACIP